MVPELGDAVGAEIPDVHTHVTQYREASATPAAFSIVRRKAPETHKRMMILATLMPLGAAITRIEWLPTSLPGSYVSQYAYLLLWLAPAPAPAPALMYDIVRRGAVHRTYVIGIALVLPYAIVSQLWWGSDWWVATAPRLMGVVN